MLFCPECSAEYTSGVSTCADCQIELTPERPSEDIAAYVDWEVVQEIPSEFVGNLIKGVLEGEDYLGLTQWYDHTRFPRSVGSGLNPSGVRFLSTRIRCEMQRWLFRTTSRAFPKMPSKTVMRILSESRINTD